MIDKIDPKVIAQRWVHSYEEDTDQTMVFRPVSFPLPPARGRKSFELSADGNALLSPIGPDDRPGQGTGHWRLDEANRLTLRPAGASVPNSVLEVLSVEPDKLVVKKR